MFNKNLKIADNITTLFLQVLEKKMPKLWKFLLWECHTRNKRSQVYLN